MADCSVKLPDEIYKIFENITTHTDEILTSMLESGGKVVLVTAKANLNRAVTGSSERSTGELESSLGLSPVDIDAKGRHNIKIGFREPRKNQSGKSSKSPVTNAMLANILEYGRSTVKGGKRVQSPRPFMRPAKVASKNPALEVMKSTFDEEISKLEVK